MKKTLIILGVIVLFLGFIAGTLYFLGKNLAGGGGSEQKAPDTIKTGEPAVIKFYVTAWGGGGQIHSRYRNISLHYKLGNESDYKTLTPQSIPLPDNYKEAIKENLEFEAFQFTIPPYLVGTTGEIEYYIDLTFDGYSSRLEGVKKIKLVN